MSYIDCIKTPSEQGSNTKAKYVQKNFKTFFSYMDLLISGKGSANKCKGVPGAQYFQKTNSKCSDNGEDKYNYYSFKPMGTVGGVDLGGMGGTQSGNQGLIMGVLESLTQVSPDKILNNIKNASSSKCVKVTAPVTVKEDGTLVTGNTCEYESHYIDELNVGMIEPCMISNYSNPYRTTNSTCPRDVQKKLRNTCKATILESFSNYNGNDDYNINNSYSYYNNKEDDILADTFYVTFSLATIYLLYLFLKKEKAI